MRTTAGHIYGTPVRRRRKPTAALPITHHPSAWSWPENSAGPGAANSLGTLMGAVVERTKAEMEAGWRPLLEQATVERDALRAELEEERRKHQRWLELATSRARADAATIARQVEAIRRLEDDVHEFRMKPAAEPKAAP